MWLIYIECLPKMWQTVWICSSERSKSQHHTCFRGVSLLPDPLQMCLPLPLGNNINEHFFFSALYSVFIAQCHIEDTVALSGTCLSRCVMVIMVRRGILFSKRMQLYPSFCSVKPEREQTMSSFVCGFGYWLYNAQGIQEDPLYCIAFNSVRERDKYFNLSLCVE